MAARARVAALLFTLFFSRLDSGETQTGGSVAARARVAALLWSQRNPRPPQCHYQLLAGEACQGERYIGTG